MKFAASPGLRLCTGFGGIIDPEEARTPGFREFAAKPVSLLELADIIRRLRDGSRRQIPRLPDPGWRRRGRSEIL